MATLSDIKKRIGSVKSTQKITKAMKMVAAAKLRRAQSNLMNHRPYANKLQDVVKEMVHASYDDVVHPLLKEKETANNIELLIYTSNKGLCGGFNSNLLRKSESMIKEWKAKNINTAINVIGKKARDFFKVRHIEMAYEYLGWADKLSFKDATGLASKAVNRFLSDDLDEYYIVYNSFVSTITHEITKQRLLPITLDSSDTINTAPAYGFDFIYEPEKIELYESILKQYIAIQIYRAHLESVTSELGARMAAMENATNNAGDMISYLTLQYNRARQAAITTELMDIVNGAEALR